MNGWLPPRWHSVTPRIVVDDPGKLVSFLKSTFDAKGEVSPDAPALVEIGDSIVMISGEGVRAAEPSFLHVYVEDADVTFQRAIAAGAACIEAPADMPYGDRRAMVKDPCGNDWQIATYRPRN